MERRYAIIIRITLVSLFLVIIAGSVVRMTGSGMGCPDWPKCFGRWIPPTSVDQLPTNYKEVFAEKRKVKVERFSRLLETFGFNQQAQELREDPDLYQEQEFNAAKTWTEAINRYIGAISGIMVLICTVLAIRFYRHHPNWFWISFINLLLILLTAWFGAVVVATNLMPWIITTHMLMAIALVLNQVNLLTRVIRPRFRVNVTRGFRFLLGISILLTLIQIILGTQVRQQIDENASLMGEDYRAYWINFTGFIFKFHRTFSIALVLTTLWLMFISGKHRYSLSLLNLVFIFLVLEAGIGVILNYLGMPKFAQPLHLLLGTVIICLQYYIYRRTQRR